MRGFFSTLVGSAPASTRSFGISLGARKDARWSGVCPCLFILSTSLKAPVSVPTTEFVAEQPSAPEMAEAESAKAKQHSDAILVS